MRDGKLSALLSMNKAVLRAWNLEKALSTIVEILPHLLPHKMSAIFFNEEMHSTLFLNTFVQNPSLIEEFKSYTLHQIEKEFFLTEESVHCILRSSEKSIHDGRMQWYISVPIRSKEVDFLFCLADTLPQNVEKEECECIFSHCALLLENFLLEQKLQRLRIYDRLTGVYALNHLLKILHAEIKRAERYKLIFSLVVLDIDDFSRINLLYGHQQADMLLKEIAARIRASIREVDVIGRYKGAGFAAILPETTKIRAIVAASHMKDAVEGVCWQREKVRARTGIATYPYDATSVEELFSYAEFSLKENGSLLD